MAATKVFRTIVGNPISTGIKHYRPEINGLRAIAVLSILLFHLGFNAFPGGYVGVDIFFVISGYLISRSIIADINAQRFSLKQFYYRRARRLFPAYSITLIVTALASALILSSEHIYHFGQALLSSLLWVSNIFFWSESGYFDISSSYKPLLHTWSLSIEEQFYLIWPSLMLVLLKLRNRLFAPIMLISLSLISLFLAEHWLIRNASTAFYWLPFRVFEFGLGALVIWAEKRLAISSDTYKNLMGAIGIGLIGYAVFTFNPETPFPGVHALYPCLGSALLIFAGPSTVSNIILQNRLCVFVGLISYSLYLVHWPLIVLYGYGGTPNLSVVEQYSLGITSVALASLMWKFVEQPFRHGGKSKLGVINRINTNFLKASSALFLVCAILGVSMWPFDGWSWRFDSALITATEAKAGRDKRYHWANQGCQIMDFPDGENCKTEKNQGKVFTTLIIGNSHALDGYNIWKSAFGDLPGHRIIWFGSVNKCGKYRDGKKRKWGDSKNCFERFSILNSPEFLMQLDTVVFSSKEPFSLKKEQDYQLFQQMREANPNIQFVIFSDYLSTNIDCTQIYNRYLDFSRCASPEFVVRETNKKTLSDYRFRYLRAVEKLDPYFIDKWSLLCSSDDFTSCTTHIGAIPFAYDRHHLSFEFSVYIGKLIRERYSRELIEKGLIPSLPGHISIKNTLDE